MKPKYIDIRFIVIFPLLGLLLGACSGPPVVINKAVAAKKVDTSEVRRAIATTRTKLASIDAHAEAAGVAVAAAESILPALPADAVAVPLSIVTLSPEQVVQIHLDFTKARGEILQLRGEVKLANDAQSTAETSRAIAQERGDVLAAADEQKTAALNTASSALATSEKERAEASGSRGTWIKLCLASWAIGGIYLFLRLSPWTRLFVP